MVLFVLLSMQLSGMFRLCLTHLQSYHSCNAAHCYHCWSVLVVCGCAGAVLRLTSPSERLRYSYNMLRLTSREGIELKIHVSSAVLRNQFLARTYWAMAASTQAPNSLRSINITYKIAVYAERHDPISISQFTTSASRHLITRRLRRLIGPLPERLPHSTE